MDDFTKNHIADWMRTRVLRGFIDAKDAKDAGNWISDQLSARKMSIEPKSLRKSPFESLGSSYAHPVVYLWCAWLLNNPFKNRNYELNGKTVYAATEAFCGSRLAKKGQFSYQNHLDTVSIALSYMYGFNPNTVICRPVFIEPLPGKVWERKTKENGFGERVRETKNLDMWKIGRLVHRGDDGFTVEETEVTCPKVKIDQMMRSVSSGESILFARQSHGELTYRSQSVNNVFFLSVFRAVAHRIGETIGRQPGKNTEGMKANIVTLESVPADQWATLVDEPWLRIEPVDVFQRMLKDGSVTDIDNRILVDHYQILQCEGGTMEDWYQSIQGYTGIASFQGAEKRLYRIRKTFRETYQQIRYEIATEG